MDFKEEITRYLGWKQWKTYQLADKANLSRASLYRYLKGERDLYYESVTKLKKAMKD